MTRLDQKKRAEDMAEMWRRGAEAPEIAAAFGVKRPAVYNALRRTGALPPYGKRVSRRTAKLSSAPVVVTRDPCPRCGTRADYGCRHTQALGLAIAGHEADKSTKPQPQGMRHEQGA